MIKITAMSALLCVLTLFSGCKSVELPANDLAEYNRVINAFHVAASEADEATYFGLFHTDGVFLGTDATERWTVEQFRAYAKPYFDQGRGWTYNSTVRNISVSPDGRTVWFDELLENENLGQCRGSGVLLQENGAWKIAQYNLSIPIPNDLALEVVGMIRQVD